MVELNNLSKLVLGTANFSGTGGGYGFGEIGDREVRNIFEGYSDINGNFLDTAPIYGFNNAELRVGKLLKEFGREKYFICSKAGVGWHENSRVNMSNHPDHIKKMFEQSRLNLDSDCIDLYMIHWPDPNVDIRKSLEPIIKFQDQGKIRFIGLSNTNPNEINLAKEVCHLEFIQGECNLFNNALSFVEDEIKTMAWGMFDKGILAQTVTKERTFDKDDARSWAPWWKKSNWKSKVDKATEWSLKIDDRNLLAFAFEYSLRNSNHSMIAPKSMSQLNTIREMYNNRMDDLLFKKSSDAIF